MITVGIIIIVLAVLVGVTFLAASARYKRCPSDKILVIYGKVGTDKSAGDVADTVKTAKCIHGGAAFVWPLIQDYQYLDLTPMSIDINLTKALSKENIRVNAPSTFTVGISTEPGVMNNAAERLLGLGSRDIESVASDIIFGQFRATIATMKIEEINADREKFLAEVMTNVETEIKKVGLRVINVNIRDITDESDFIESLGRKAASTVTNQAKIDVAEQDRIGESGKAAADRTREVAVAVALKEQEIGKADADQAQRIGVANANATAVEGENKAAQVRVGSDAELRVKTSEFEKDATIAETTNVAAAQVKQFEAETGAENERRKKKTAQELADTLPGAEAAKQKKIIDAEAVMKEQSLKGEGAGLEIQKRMEGEAAGVAALLAAQSKGFAALVKASGDSPALAMTYLISEQLPQLVGEQVKAISSMNIDKVTVWSGGGNSETGINTHMRDIMKTLPPLHELLNSAGLELPSYLGKQLNETSAPDDTDGNGNGGGNGHMSDKTSGKGVEHQA